MPDQYDSFAALAAHEVMGVDYRIRVTARQSPVAVMAPHGGWIEPGTSQIAAAIAGDDHSLYCFESLRRRARAETLHITSTRFDEPQALALIAASETVLTVHGRKDGPDTAAIWVGGRDADLRAAIAAALCGADFSAKAVADGHPLAGSDPANICNRGRRGAGVQMELPRALRLELMDDAARCASLALAVRRALVVAR